MTRHFLSRFEKTLEPRFGFLIKISGFRTEGRPLNVEKWRKDFKNNEEEAPPFEIQFPFW